jgi:methionyl-tRNA formyltransferase
MKLVFCGTPQFAVPTLEALASAGHDIRLVVTQPDRPSGRGRQLSAPAVKQVAAKLGFPIAQPQTLKKNPEFQEQLKKLAPEAIVVVAYGRIIPPWMLSLPYLGNFNVHASLLPKLRGAAPVQWAIAGGETSTGITIMRLDEGLDTGPILLQRRIPITSDDTALTLAPRLAQLGAELMLEALPQIAAKTLEAVPQDHSQATLARLLSKEDGLINFSCTAEEIHNRLRGFQPWPGVYTRFRGRQLELVAARPAHDSSGASLTPGGLLRRGNQLFFICARGTLLEVLELQPAGKQRMTAQQFLNGYHPENGEALA